ncbi:flagellar basal body L-ring protein FlgH [Termitidicoccus mucosus]|uniref:Flagellar L-ring protein n=1 Tax=Termitidicoccus mucosus TaxID=1184151 RepID=A0A178IF50_9BACT|nr:flagellar biosynthesis protein FlgH [Opitutaceae bacterium TSB47]
MNKYNLLPLVVLALAALPAAAQSLWTAPGSREQSLVADPKAGRIGDIVTIVVAESAAQSSTQSKQTNSNSSANAAVNQFLYPSTASKFGTHNGALPGVSFSGASEFSGGGAVNNAQVITARAAVVVTDVLPNGNLVIAGARRITFSGETQHIILHGVVRRDDISSTNTVLSSNVADTNLEFISEGALTDAQKRGWLSRIYEKLRPF